MTIFTGTEQQLPFENLTSAMDFLLLVMLGWVAVYGFYTVIRLKKEYMLFPNKFLYPSGCTAENCLNEGEYIDFIIPRLIILSVVCLIFAIAYGVLIYGFPEVNHWAIDIATLVLPVGIVLWYAIIQNKVSKIYW